MRKNGIFHPQFFYHARPVVESAMIAEVEVYRATGAVPEWTGGETMADNMFNLIWSGKGRVQPNKDWRARPREFAGEFTATQAVRIQLGIGKNEFGAVLDGQGNVITYGEDVEFRKDDVVIVTNVHVKGAEFLEGNRYFVRNAQSSSNTWIYNLLCDIDTKSGGGNHA